MTSSDLRHSASRRPHVDLAVILVCPGCGATSIKDHPGWPAHARWSRAGICHLGDEGERVEPVYYVAEPVMTDALVGEIIEIVTGWTGDTGTDYMAVTVQIREALAHNLRLAHQICNHTRGKLQ